MLHEMKSKYDEEARNNLKYDRVFEYFASFMNNISESLHMIYNKNVQAPFNKHFLKNSNAFDVNQALKEIENKVRVLYYQKLNSNTNKQYQRNKEVELLKDKYHSKQSSMDSKFRQTFNTKIENDTFKKYSQKLSPDNTNTDIKNPSSSVNHFLNKYKNYKNTLK